MTDARAAYGRALQAFELDDIFVTELNCKIVSDFNQQSQLTNLRMQYRFEPRRSSLIQTRKDTGSDKVTTIFRYYVEGGVRIIKPDAAQEKTEFSDEEILAEITGVLAVDYLASKDLRDDPEAINAFGTNVVLHAWPHWRSIVLCRAAELRLPRIVLPMLRPTQRLPVSEPTATIEKQT